ncbi:hypothetical protein WS73_01285 [Burkholderia savannae]|uniref:hypothetical protein n=1 Tax=Burkholderia savannae TaxID=1637837 RepID=UPI0007642486|nr:hypothetical protein [Burkholderia savannae]KWZ47265.1 hypothetical protein WS73_01285 [Burkholderia savannae]
MITAIVQYRLPPSIDIKACEEHFRKIAPGFRTVPGLTCKQFIYAEDGWAGGVYRWKTRADAEAFLQFGVVARRYPRALRHGSVDFHGLGGLRGGV